MKILYVTNRFLPELGGVQKFISQTSEYLPASVDVTVYTTKSNACGLKDTERLGRILVKRFKRNLTLGPFILSIGLIKNLLRTSQHYDLVNFQGLYRFNTLFATIIRLVRGDKLILTTHGLALNVQGLPIIKRIGKKFFDNLFMWMLKFVFHHIFVVSIVEAKYLRKYGIDETKIRVISPGVNPTWIEYTQSDSSQQQKGMTRLLGYVGTFEHRKNIPDLLLVFKKIQNVMPDTRLVLVGPCSYNERKRVEQLASKHGISQKVQIRGPISERELVKTYRRLDVFLFTSLNEGFPTVLLETAAMGTPFVAYDIPSIRYFSSKVKAGVLVPSKRVNHMAEVVLKLLGDDKLRNKLGQRGQRDTKYYMWPKVSQRLFNSYLQLLGREKNKVRDAL